MYFILSKGFKTYKKILGTSWEKYHVCKCGHQKKTNMIEGMCTMCFAFCFLVYHISFYIIFCENEDQKMIIFHKNIPKSLDMKFISIKNRKWKFCNMYQISFENMKHVWNQETKNQETLFLFWRKGIIQY